MAREYGKLWFSLFASEHFCAQPILDKLLFTVLIGQPAFNYAGLSPIQFHKWSRGCRPATELELKAALIRLERNRYVFTDSYTHEVLIRTFIRNDEVEKQPNMLISALGSAAVVESPKLAAVLLEEMDKIAIPATSNIKVRDRLEAAVARARTRLAATSEGVNYPLVEPFPEDFPISTDGSPRPAEMEGDAEGVTQGLAEPPVVVAVVVAGSTAAGENSRDQESGGAPRRANRKRPAISLPTDWTPTAKHLETVRANGVDLDHEVQQFRHHAAANDRRQANWNAAFSQWLGNARPRLANSGSSESGRLWQD